MSERILHFTLGPVQSFIAQARRTRDLWAGSFLLSWLSGHAMKVVMDQRDSRIEFPCVHNEVKEPTDPLLKAIYGVAHENPYIGTLPNRFKAIVPDTFDPKLCEAMIGCKWQELAGAVYEMFVAPVATHGNGTKAIWDGQIKSFWEIAWVMGDVDDKNDDTWLDLRKHWRTHFPPDEKQGGDHCTMMGEWLELSGYARGRLGESDAQKDFWQKMLESLPKRRSGHAPDDPGVGVLNLREDERLCAIAFVKRMFPKLGEKVLVDVIGWVPGGKLSTIGNWPSTAHMAAVHWIEEAHEANARACRDYAAAINSLVSPDLKPYPGLFGETMTEVRCLDAIKKGEPLSKAFAELDGPYFFRSELENERSTSFGPSDPATGKNTDPSKRQAALKAWDDLQAATEIESATPFYAILLMDGDRLGELLRDDPQGVSKSLGNFAEQQVKKLVEQHNGVLIYAGGDDVLALFPMEDAIDAAIALREAYRQAFDYASQATISGAIVYAHYHLPLKAMLREAHRQLDDIAKAQNGRDSLAIAVWQGAGRTIEWVSTWCAVGGQSPPKLLDELAAEFARERQFSSRFFYHIRDRFELLAGDDYSLMSNIDPVELLTADYLKNRELGEPGVDRAKATQRVQKLYSLCQVHRRPPVTAATLKADGALLLRFLAKNGVKP